MRLMYLSPTASIGGAERVLLNLLRTVRRERPQWVLGLIAASDGPLLEYARQLGVHTVVLPFPGQLTRLGDSGLSGPGSWARFLWRAGTGLLALVRYRRRLRRTIEAFVPDVLHSNGFKMHVLGALARPRATALIWHFHDYLGSRRVTNRVINALKRRCSVGVAVSTSVAEDVRRQLGNAFEVRTVWNAIDLDRFAPDGPSVDLDSLSNLPPAEPGVVRVGLVATFARWKGQLLFLDVMRELVPVNNVRGYIVGGPIYETDGSQFSIEELREATCRRGMDGAVGLTGFVEDSAAVFRNLDIVVHASTEPEPFGLVIAEAMAVGRPVVVSRAGGAGELVDAERDALTYAPGDRRDLTRQIQRLVADRTLRERLGHAAHESAAAKFSLVRASQEMLGLYTRFGRAAA